MRWLLLRMYMDFLENGWAVWDEELREGYMGRSLPPIAVLPNQACEIIAMNAVIRAAAIRREG